MGLAPVRSMMRLVIGDKNLSSWSLRPWLVLKQASVAFEEILIPLDRPTTRAQILQYSPTGKVPVLLDGDLMIWDSLAIAEYIAERFPDLWPHDPATRAHARAATCEMHSGFASLRQQMPMNILSRRQVPRTPALDQDIARVLEIWCTCRNQAAGGPFLFGAFSIADAFYAPVVTRFITYGVELDAQCNEYAQSILALPARQEWVAAAEL